MVDWIFYIFGLIAFGIIGFFMYVLGTRASINKGGYCEVDDHWWFGWFVRCEGGERCTGGDTCDLQWRKKGTEEHWADAGVVPGGSVKWSPRMEYRCVC
jgi:hypothetical protein